MDVTIDIYLKSNVVYSYKVKGMAKAREHAKRIITEGLICNEGNDLIFYPTHYIFKVRIREYGKEGKYRVEPYNPPFVGE